MPEQLIPAADAVCSPIEVRVAIMRAVYTNRVQRARVEARKIRAIFVLFAQRYWRVWQNSHSSFSARADRRELPPQAQLGEVARRAGGVMSNRTDAHDPSVATGAWLQRRA